MEKDVNKPILGLNKDNNHLSQPENTYSFALNTVNESNEGDFQSLSNENSNDIYAFLKPDFILIGSVYIGDGETCLFSVKNDNSESEIGILSEKQSVNNTEAGNNYKVWCNDKLSDNKNKLNFRVDKQIQAVYRLRRGCEKNVYWVDNYNEIRQVNLSDYRNYTQEDNELKLNINKFKLIKNINVVNNVIKNISVLDYGGSLPNGSIKILIRFIDKYDNPTNFFWESINYLIYPNSLKKGWENIFGELRFNDKEKLTTSKAIELELDFSSIKDYDKFQFAFIIYSDSTGFPTEVLYSNILSTNLNNYTFTGRNYLSKGTIEEVVLFNEEQKLREAKTITFKDNRLVVGNLKNEYENYTNLQKFASKIKTDIIYKVEYLNDLTKHNSKHPEQHEVGVGCIPGEVYSLGISYIIEKNNSIVETPVFHIPAPTSKSILDNNFKDENYKLLYCDYVENKNLLYNDIDQCSKTNYYGLDYLGEPLKNKNFRFHKVPTIDNFNIKLKQELQKSYHYENSHIFNEGFLSFIHRNFEFKNHLSDPNGDLIRFGTASVYFEFKNSKSEITKKDLNRLDDLFDFEELKDDIIIVGGVKALFTLKTYSKVEKINTTNNNVEETKYYFEDKEYTPENINGYITVSSEDIEEEILDDTYKKVTTYISYQKEVTLTKTTDINLKEEKIELSYNNVMYLKLSITKIEKETLKVENLICGFHLSNIILPESPNFKVIGYNLYKQIKSENDKIILDEVFFIPTVTKNDFIGGQIYQDGEDFSTTRISNTLKTLTPDNYEDTTYNILSPKHKFLGETFDNSSHIVINEIIRVDKIGKDGFFYQDVSDVTDEESGSSNYDDKHDGIDFKMLCRDVFLQGSLDNEKEGITPVKIKKENFKLINLDAYSYFNDIESSKTIVNLDFLNRNLFINFDSKAVSELNTFIGKFKNTNTRVCSPKNRYYYKGYFINENNTVFENFKQAKFEKLNNKILTDSSYNTFNFDGFKGLFNFSSINYVRTLPKQPIQKQPAWKAIASAVGFVLGVVALIAFPPAGAGLLATTGFIGGALVAVGSVILGYKTVLDSKAIQDIFTSFWDKGVEALSNDRFLYPFAYGMSYDNETRPGQDNIIVYSGWTINNIPFTSDFNFSLYPERAIDGSINLSHPNTNNINERKEKLFLKKCNKCNDLSLRSTVYGKKVSNNVFQSIGNVFSGETEFPELYPTNQINNGSGIVHPNNKTAFYFKSKTLRSAKRKHNLELYGPNPLEYFVNKDYSYIPNIKNNYIYQLPKNCSKCEEEYPQRFYWSGVDNSEAYQSYLTQFKPNDYKDISGEYGEITNIFTFNNNLYIHTTEGLWVQPTNPQEQLLNDVTLYIGTGEFGSLPPQLIIDDKNGTSAGLQHREAQILTPYGYFFVSERERKIYKFDGKLEPISDKGMTKWFNDNIPLVLNRQYRKNTGEEYKYNDNPSNFLGTGFILTYDKERERVMITKKDYIPNQTFIENQGYEICLLDNNITLFLDINKTKSIMENYESDDKRLLLSKATKFTDVQGVEVSSKERPKVTDNFRFVGVENCQMKFESWIEVTKKLCKEDNVIIKKDTIVFVHYDMSGSYDNFNRVEGKRIIDSWFEEYKAKNPDYKGQVIHYHNSNACVSQRSFYILREIEEQIPDAISKNILGISFANEADINACNPPQYHNSNLIKEDIVLSGVIEDTNYADDYFKRMKEAGGSFTGLLYPVTYVDNQSTKAHLRFMLQISKNRPFTEEEANAVTHKSLNESELNTLRETLKGPNVYAPYSEKLFNNFILEYKGGYDRHNDPNIINEEEFKNTLDRLVSGDITVSINNCTDVKELKQVFTYIPGQRATSKGIINNGWTISYSLKYNTWTSFHSYEPNFYFRMNEKHFSWVNGDNNIYLHNKPNHYQTFYGIHYPQVIEYVDNNNPLVTKIFDHIRLLTDAKRYDEDTKEHYDERWITFNKAILYNSRQCSGELNLKVKDITPEQEFYLSQQVLNENNNVIFLDRNERDWLLNDFRDYRIEYRKPIFNSDRTYISEKYKQGYIDKILNEDTISLDKDWYNLESLRDKYLVVRLFFNHYDSVKLIFNFTTNEITQSIY